MTKREKKLIVLSLVVSLLLIASSYFYLLGSEDSDTVSADQPQSESSTSTTAGEIGEPGSDHTHMAFILSIEGSIYNFNRDKYTEQSNRAHFHQDDGFFIHKHATGVTLPYMMDTLGINLSEDCLTLDTGESYCQNGDNRITMVVNGRVVNDFENYELQHGDRIFLDYSSDNITDIRIKAQSLPETSEWPRELVESVYGPQGE